MSHPFFIWTLRRTGGTTLTDLLMSLSEHPATDHEPFLIDRALGEITRSYMEGKTAETRNMLREVFSRKVIIKHCYEILGKGFNDLLFETLCEYPEYRHIFLLRRDETSRMLSLLLAYQTDVWGKHGSEWVYEQIRSGQRELAPFDLELLAREESRAIEETEHVTTRLKQSKAPHIKIYFEEIYQGPEAHRFERLEELFDFLDLDSDTIKAKEKEIRHMILHRSQKSRNVLGFVPNIQEVRSVLEGFPGRESITGESNLETDNFPKKEASLKSFQKLTLYLGAHKTATTHLQGILHANRNRLAEEGIKLSMPGDVRKEWLQSFFHWCNHKDSDSREKIQKAAPEKGTWLLTEENIAGVSNDFTIKSGIYPHIGARLKCLRSAWPEPEMELFFSLRSYETFYRSAYSEVVRNRGYIPFDEFYDEERFKNNSWVETVRQFVEVIPQERITLWRYEDFRKLVPSILKAMTGIDDTETMIAAYKAETTRPSLSQKTIDILDSLHPVLNRQESKKLVERINNAYPVSGGYEALRTFSSEEEARFKAQYDDDVATIRRLFPKINFLRPESE